MATAEVGEATESFLDVLRSEQFRYLDSVAAANEMLRHEPGRVALIAAIQNRLTQQFFDAQRSIIMRQAVYDTEVGRIEARAEADVDGIVSAAQARIRSLTAAGRPLAPPSDSARAEVPAPEPGVALARRTQEALAGMAASSDVREPDPESVQRQLGALLDQWWTVLNQDGQVQIDQAHARAAMRRHVASIESGIVEMPTGEVRPVDSHASARRTPVQSSVADARGLPTPVVSATHSLTPPLAAPRPVAPVTRPVVVTMTPPPPPAPAPIIETFAAPAVERPLPPPGTVVPTAQTQMPARLLEALESAPIGDLRALLATLDRFLVQPHATSESLSPRPAVSTEIAVMSPARSVEPTGVARPLAAAPHVDVPAPRRHDLVIRTEAFAGTADVAQLGRPEAAQVAQHANGSWRDHQAGSTVSRIVSAFPTHVVLPMVAATSVITILLALVG